MGGRVLARGPRLGGHRPQQPQQRPPRRRRGRRRWRRRRLPRAAAHLRRGVSPPRARLAVLAACGCRLRHHAPRGPAAVQLVRH
eukprot:scaffold4880_cov206-Prasinococcus_capsulatus_cf.AAC.3